MRARTPLSAVVVVPLLELGCGGALGPVRVEARSFWVVEARSMGAVKLASMVAGDKLMGRE